MTMLRGVRCPSSRARNLLLTPTISTCVMVFLQRAYTVGTGLPGMPSPEDGRGRGSGCGEDRGQRGPAPRPGGNDHDGKHGRAEYLLSAHSQTKRRERHAL